MKKNHLNITLILLIILSSVSFVKAIAFTDCNTKPGASMYTGNPIVNRKLPTPREFIPPSLKGSVYTTAKSFQKQTNLVLECHNFETTLCASFETNTTPELVSAWMGFRFEDKTGDYFLATYGQEAVYVGDNTYATKKWDKGHFWINIGENIVPFPMQPRFVGVDKESGYEWHVVDYFGFQAPDINYSDYIDNLSMSALVMLINPKTKKVEDYHLEYYDENDEYSGDYKIEIGDKVQTTFLAFKKGEEDTDYLVSIEGLTEVTHPITFEYKEQYPGIDFDCSFCGNLNFMNVEFQYIFEEFGEERSTFTKPQSVEVDTNTSESNVSTNSSSSNSKSVPISSFWLFIFLSLVIAFITFKNEHRLSKN